MFFLWENASKVVAYEEGDAAVCVVDPMRVWPRHVSFWREQPFSQPLRNMSRRPSACTRYFSLFHKVPRMRGSLPPSSEEGPWQSHCPQGQTLPYTEWVSGHEPAVCWAVALWQGEWMRRRADLPCVRKRGKRTRLLSEKTEPSSCPLPLFRLLGRCLVQEQGKARQRICQRRPADNECRVVRAIGNLPWG